MTNSPPIELEPPVKPAEKFNPTWVGSAVLLGLAGSAWPGVGCVAVNARKPSCADIVPPVFTLAVMSAVTLLLPLGGATI